MYVNAVGANELDFTTNNFHATPEEQRPDRDRPHIPNAALRARFRIANWGSAGFDSPEWKTACQSGGGGTNGNSGDDFDLQCTWTGFDACPYRPAGFAGCGAVAGTKDPHQCVLVDLGILTGVEHFFFSVQSVFRNMNFDVNSTLVRQATIDIKGLGPMPGGAATRDVFLYVQTRNLPEKIGDEPPAPPASDRGGNIVPPRQRFKESSCRRPARSAPTSRRASRPPCRRAS